MDIASDVEFDDLVDIFALNTVSSIKADPRAKSKATNVISVLDISAYKSRER